MSQLLCDLLEAQGIDCRADAPMAAYTTLRVGGAAECLAEPHSTESAALAMYAAQAVSAPVTVIGRGSNLLVRTGGIKGLVLCIGRAMSGIEIEGTQMRVGAGATLHEAARAAWRAGLSGLEALEGIPGTVGGAACMNAGAYGAEMAQVVQSVEALDVKGYPRMFDSAALAYGYRQSALQNGLWVITKVTLNLTPGDPEAIAEAMAEYHRRRWEKQPLDLPSAGSFFKRPPGQFAGTLIEAAGLKGFAIGGAQVSEKHAGFLVNTGGATADDFIELMKAVQARVFDHSGVRLEPEVRILGCDTSY
ncbi:MAG: UDP-N-acetylmuramate dehydrogenase [Oscillospiraceae bacterium]|jgi:UDP-N-acetylmuramate dehydrogenase|nr:UDP-N-acetylmuramate dehydrogenase [Oscillospiraceae bacterium]